MHYFSYLITLLKGRNHKYVRRVPYRDNKGRRRYRYFYRNQTLRGQGFGSISEIADGASYEYIGDDGERGHLSVKIDKKTGRAVATHDETGKVHTFRNVEQFQIFIREHHAEEISEDKKRFFDRLRMERSRGSIRTKLTERRAEFLGLSVPLWEGKAPQGMIADINDFSHLRYKIRLEDKRGRLLSKWVTEATAQEIVENGRQAWRDGKGEKKKRQREEIQEPLTIYDAVRENHKKHADVFEYDFETSPQMVHPRDLDPDMLGGSVRLWVRPKGTDKWLKHGHDSGHSISPATRPDGDHVFWAGNDFFGTRELTRALRHSAFRDDTTIKDTVGAGGLPVWKTLFLQAEEHGYEAVFALPDTKIMNATRGRRESISLSAGVPPNFMGLNIEAFKFKISEKKGKYKTFRNYTLEGDDTLEKLGFFEALGTGNWGNIIFGNLVEATRGISLSERQRSIISQSVSRLSVWWSGLNDQEREEFYHTYLDPELQTQGVLRHPLHENADLEIPSGMEKMRKRGWSFHEYQKKAINFAIDQKRVVWAMEMGLGKTLSALGAYHHMRERGDISKMFITAPLSAHGSWIEHLGGLSNVRYEVLSGVSKKKRLEAYERFKKGEIDVLVTSPEAIRKPKSSKGAGDYEHIEEFLNEDVLYVADEVHKFKGGESSQGLAFQELSPKAGACIGMTGTPKPNKPEDFYYIMKRVNPDWEVSHDEFKERYCLSDEEGNPVTFDPSKLWEFHEINAEQLFIRSTNDPDARLNLPDRKDLSPALQLDETQRKFIEGLALTAEVKAAAVRAMNKPDEEKSGNEWALISWYEQSLNLLGSLESGSVSADEISSQEFLELAQFEAAPMGLKPMLTRIDQLTTDPKSAAPLTWERYAKLQGHMGVYETPKMRLITDSVIDHLETHPETGAVVFCEYVQALETTKEALVRRGIPPDQIAVYYGAVTPKRRREIERQLNEGEIKVILGQTKALETGANLQKRANFVAHLNTPFAPDTLTQSTARVYRQGQRRPTTILRPTGSPIDEIKDRLVTRKISQTGQATGAVMVADEGAIRTTADKRKQSLDAETIARVLNIPQLAKLTDSEPDIETVPTPPPLGTTPARTLTANSTTEEIITLQYTTAAQQKKIKKGEGWAQSAISRDKKTGQNLKDFLNMAIFKGKLHTDEAGHVTGSDDTKTNSSFWAGVYVQTLRTLMEQ